jgi:hypothetical protein
MLKSVRLGSSRFFVAIAALLTLGLSSTTTSASAATVQTNCGPELQNALNAAKAGDVITLDELCTSGFPYKLPAVAVTLAGTPGAGFDGGTTTQLEGGEAPATIEGLLFENAKSSTPDSGGGLSINTAGQAFDITLAGDSFVDDSASPGEGGGARINTSIATVTVEDSTFTGDSASESGGGLLVTAGIARMTGDTFDSDSTGTEGVGGGLLAELRDPGSTLSDSQFSGDTATGGGGGAAISTQAAGGIALALNGDAFSHDSVADPSGSHPAFAGYAGGGLTIAAYGAEPTTVVQDGDTFEANSVSFKAAPIMASGGGESVEGATVQSTDDQFTGNTLQSPDEAEDKTSKSHVFGWGAGLSIVACGDTGLAPAEGPNLRSTLTDAVVAGNILDSGPSANGAGIYVGSFACHSSYAELVLADSTVSGNAIAGASGPVAGISGGPHDVLSLANTILDGDGGPELGGFNNLASVTAASSDVCSGASPFAGAGNICAAPLLAAPSTGDVHETSSSPTIDAGSNALVPSGLSTDVYGDPRILADHAVCSGSAPAVVDIGAAESELAPVALSCPPPRSGAQVLLPPAPGLTHFVRLRTNHNVAALTLSCSSTDGLGCSGTIYVTSDEILHGKRIVGVGLEGHTKVPLRLAQVPFSLAPGATATIHVKLDSTGLKLLRRFHAFSTFVIANEKSPTSTPFIFLFHTARFSAPAKPKPKRHQFRHSR